MKQRIITALFILAGAILILCTSGTVAFPIVMGLLSAVTVFEFLRCVGLYRRYLIAFSSYALAALLPFFGYFATEAFTYFGIVSAVLFGYMLCLFVAAVFSNGGKSVSETPTLSENGLRFRDLAIAFTGDVYIIASFTAIVLIRRLGAEGIGLYLFIAIFAIAWLTDVFAYFGGYLFGKHKLIPAVSPKKTVEGAISGLLGGIVGGEAVALAVSLFTELSPNYIVFGVMAFVASVVSQIGDLIASLIKREYGIKDYGNIFPGHGGMFDRFDSVIAVSTVILLFSTFGGVLSLLA